MDRGMRRWREIDFPAKYVAIRPGSITFVVSCCWNVDMCKFESSQSYESRARQADSSKDQHPNVETFCSKPAMSNPNGLLGQKSCRYLNQGRTLNNILMRAAQWMAYFELSKLNLT